MLWFIIFGILTGGFAIAGLVAYIIDENAKGYYGHHTSLFIFTTIFGIILFFMGATLINREARFNAVIADYENTVALVDTYTGGDYGNMPALTEKVIHLNTIIARHKTMSPSIWTGPWYSKKIGALEPITFNKPIE